MGELDTTSFTEEEVNLEIKKYFSKYIIDIELEIQKYGFNVTQSEILGFILEKMAAKKSGTTTVSSLQNLSKREMNLKAEDISHYIINRKFPFVEKFQRSDENLNKFQLAIKQSRLNNLSAQSTVRLLEFSNLLNSIFVIISIFLGFQSLYVLAYIFTSAEGKDTMFLELDGGLIYQYKLLWQPSTIMLMGLFFIFNLTFSYLVLNLPTLSRIKPNLNDNYNKLILKIKLNFIMAISFVSFMVLGSVSVILNNRINGFDPINDLGLPIVITLISGIAGVFMLMLLRKERRVDLSYEKSNSLTRVIIYVTNFLTLVLSLILFTYLALVVNGDFEEIDGLSPGSHFVPMDLEVLNLVSFVSFLFFFFIISISSLLNHSRLKNKWHKFILIQILFQSLLVLLYSVLEYYFITTYNDFAVSTDRNLIIRMSDLTQGIIKYYGSVIIYISLLRISK